jgi:type II secretory pathway pseudopilin PulG
LIGPIGPIRPIGHISWIFTEGNRLTICPCCGFKFHGALSNGCKQCGARAVGEPLPRPAHELPSYGRAFVLAAGGSLVALTFVVQTLIALFQRSSNLYDFWHWVAAGETAAWRLKWISIPVLIATFWLGRKLYRSILLQPRKFCGVKYAQGGLVASGTVVMLIALLIGVTVPARLEHRAWAKEAAVRAQGYVLEQALSAYKIKYQTYPADLKDLLERLPDPDGSLAAALANIAPRAYNPSADLAVVAAEKSPRLRGAVIRKTSLSSATDDTPAGGLAFTNYVLRLPGEDKITGNDDDWIVYDGMVMRLSDSAKGGVGRSVSAGALAP